MITPTAGRDDQNENSQISELIFYFNERNQKYYLSENIGDKYYDDNYEEILKGLKQADTISIWIKNKEINEYEPEVFQINGDNEILLDFNAARTRNGLVTEFMLILGLVSITVFFWFRFPEKFNRIWSSDRTIK